MRKHILLFLFLISGLAISQTHRFIYEFKFKPDSTAADYEKANMTLDVNPEDVKFYPYEYAETDSLNKIRNFYSATWDDKLPALVRKRNSDRNLNYILLDDLFVLKSADVINWKLLPETKTTGKYKLQKATTKFGGRTWIAWFSPDINLNEGPYKFRGLPGLIFEVSDEKQYFSFNLIKSWKLKDTYNTKDILEFFAGQKAIPVTDKILRKKQLEYFNDPLRQMRENFSPDPNTTYKVFNIKVTNKEQFKELTKMMQDRIRKTYNPIELDKAINYPKE